MASPLLYMRASGEFMKTQIKLASLIFMTALLMACGSSKSGGDSYGEADLGSNGGSGGSSSNNTDALAVCSKDGTALSDFQVHLQQYVDQYGQARKDIVRLRIVKAPTAWQTSNLDLSVYRWTASPSGAVSADNTPLNFQFERRAAGGFQMLTNTIYRYFNWGDIVQMGKFANITTTSPQSFWDVASIVVDLKDTTNSYQALQVVLWDTSTSPATAARRVDVLIPTFQADPAKYNADSRHPSILQNLHPLKSLVGQNWSQANYDQFARAFCF